MRKLRFVIAAVVRIALLLVPGAAFLWWAWPRVPALFSVLAAIGVEAVWLLVFAYVAVAVTMARNRVRNRKIVGGRDE